MGTMESDLFIWGRVFFIFLLAEHFIGRILFFLFCPRSTCLIDADNRSVLDKTLFACFTHIFTQFGSILAPIGIDFISFR